VPEGWGHRPGGDDAHATMRPAMSPPSCTSSSMTTSSIWVDSSTPRIWSRLRLHFTTCFFLLLRPIWWDDNDNVGGCWHFLTSSLGLYS
jgi:hypothetical protein